MERPTRNDGWEQYQVVTALQTQNPIRVYYSVVKLLAGRGRATMVLDTILISSVVKVLNS